ncbi:hypothetical protein [Thermocrinis sp.]|jgi:hypothetical protein|uniref:hypothetical protein n=1 Tax=Thermocrinis sp. TaxID=2024383 RepID=UPI003BFB81D9
MTHGMNNNIALCFQSGVVFTVLNLQYYNWRWLKPWELIEVEFSREKVVFEVYKWERDEQKGTLIAVVSPVIKKQEVER